MSWNEFESSWAPEILSNIERKVGKPDLWGATTSTANSSRRFIDRIDFLNENSTVCETFRTSCGFLRSRADYRISSGGASRIPTSNWLEPKKLSILSC